MTATPPVGRKPRPSHHAAESAGNLPPLQQQARAAR